MALSMPLIDAMLMVTGAPSPFQNVRAAAPFAAAIASLMTASSMGMADSQSLGLQAKKLILRGLPSPSLISTPLVRRTPASSCGVCTIDTSPPSLLCPMTQLPTVMRWFCCSACIARFAEQTFFALPSGVSRQATVHMS